ncbi:MAG: NADH-ubiquinone oxidoreductase-F iron-sulfur binding region domain-containing protein, partial [Fervidobacterium sp.]
LVGDVNRRGMVELPMGVTVREVLYGFGGGVKGGRELKMVQTGGLAGTFIGPDKLDVPLDYDSMKNYGVSLGSGVILAIDDSHCVVDIALNTMEFFRHESCGKCTPCREGTRLACEILEKMTKFEATMDDLKYLEQIAILSADASFCGLGQSINVPLLSLINNFKEEFIQHIKDKYCKVGLCKEEKKEKKKAVAK